jgi:hypothetical protein
MNAIEEKEKVTKKIRNKKLGKDSDDETSLSKEELKKIKAKEARKIRDLKNEMKKKKKIVYVSDSDEEETVVEDESSSSEEEVIIKKKIKNKKKNKKLEIIEEPEIIPEQVDNRSHFEKSGLTAIEYQRYLGF